MTYQKALRYLDSFINYEKIPYYDYKKSMELNRMERFLEVIGNPHRGINIVHITGTKGKGSTAAFVSSILKEAGLNVGLYTSPHLNSFRERIKLNGNEIPENEIVEILSEIKPEIEKMKRREKLSFFEIYTALAFLYFKKKKVDCAVLEVGMGGRLDATNAADAKICAITPISLEHTEKLGSTLAEIAREKAGIIKEGAICITAPQKREALKVIEDTCRRKNARLYRVGKDIMVEESFFNSHVQFFNVWSRFGEYHGLKLKLLGQHQVVNAAVAVGIVDSLRAYNFTVSRKSIERGLFNVDWPGRLEITGRRPHIILDGAQNRASAAALVDALNRHFNFERVHLVLAMSSDKDIKGVSDIFSNFADEVIITRAKNPRAAKPCRIKKFFKDTESVTVVRDAKKALEIARSRARKEDLVLATGSLFLVGELGNLL